MPLQRSCYATPPWCRALLCPSPRSPLKPRKRRSPRSAAGEAKPRCVPPKPNNTSIHERRATLKHVRRDAFG